jgi:hypothetical protein
MADARKNGIQRLYFCARDTHTHYLIARELRDLYPSIEVKYLFISRIALYKSPLCKEYLASVGLMDDTPKAIVDMATSGMTLAVLNRILVDDGHDPIKGYFWQCTAKELDENTLGNAFFAKYEMLGLYHNLMTKAKTNRLNGMVNFYETFFSFNLHSKTIGYEYHSSVVRPIFSDTSSHGEDWTCSNNSQRIIKRENDKMVLMYIDAIKKTGLVDYTGTAYSRLLIPILADFVSYPRKQYVDYLHSFLWRKQPFVGHMLGHNKGVWHRGNRAFSLPQFILNHLYLILSQSRNRRKLNQVFSWAH